MSLTKYSPEQIKEMAMVELAFDLLTEKKQPVTFKELLEEIKSMLELTDKQVEEKIAQFYTDLNIDGRFLALQDAMWGLRKWYPYDQIEEDIAPTVKPKKKKGKKAAAKEELDEEDFDEVEEDLDFDELDDFDDDAEEEAEDDIDADDADEEDEDLAEEEFDLDEDLDTDDDEEDDEDLDEDEKSK
ncbi:DNA-directed RNA polymerase subunit delta [Metabacillus sp. RGM 3146]|uniref:DNA-directed RNA polymerase subunit delta n=1 Tax=Metabacillus sp. RGM 3146 TaxID=3401092 RepID=UPI003B9CF013